MPHSTHIAVDLAKSVFEIVVSDQPGKVLERHRLPRAKFLEFFANRPAATVVMEACGSAHFWARKIESPSDMASSSCRRPRCGPTSYVTRLTARTRAASSKRTATKTSAQCRSNRSTQQALTSLHRIRSAWVAERTAKINLLRGLLRELGLVIPVGAKKAVPHAWAFIEDEASGIPDTLRPALRRAVRRDPRARRPSSTARSASSRPIANAESHRRSLTDDSWRSASSSPQRPRVYR